MAKAKVRKSKKAFIAPSFSEVRIVEPAPSKKDILLNMAAKKMGGKGFIKPDGSRMKKPYSEPSFAKYEKIFNIYSYF